jgi:hypothetical protein
MSFKIGDKVQFKNKPLFLGYVSSVFKGQLFLLDDFEIRIHQGEGNHIVVLASYLEHYKDKDNANIIV